MDLKVSLIHTKEKKKKIRPCQSLISYHFTLGYMSNKQKLLMIEYWSEQRKHKGWCGYKLRLEPIVNIQDS